MTAVHHTYPCTLDRVVDGDTMDLVVDLGFRVSHKIRVRLSHFDAPEPRGDTRVLGKWYTEKVKLWFATHPSGLFVRTSKSGKYGRWLAEIFSGEDGKVFYLQDYLKWQSGKEGSDEVQAD